MLKNRVDLDSCIFWYLLQSDWVYAAFGPCISSVCSHTLYILQNVDSMLTKSCCLYRNVGAED